MTDKLPIALLAGIALIPACHGGSTDDDEPGDDRVQTDTGAVIGHRDGDITAYLGIPYAAPPVADLRWRAPQPVTPWSAPRDASAFGPGCAQSEGGLVQGDGPTSEDCLTVNVWTPEPAKAAKAPVMVFIHGGAFVHGSSNAEMYDGRALAETGTVVVSMNYRLGIFGYLAHPALTAEDPHHSSGNAGILDQQAALRWVASNIAGFGGDPDNVTVFGESAGSMSTCIHIASPLAADLFQGAIGESGACLTFATPLATAETLGRSIAAALGCGDASDVLACMRGMSTEQVLAAAPTADDASPDGTRLIPNVDGYVLPEAPAAAFAAGHINAIRSYLGGINHDEATLFSRALTLDSQLAYEQAVAKIVPQYASQALATYDPANYPTYKDAYNALLTDVFFACPTRSMTRALAAHGVPTYLYLFNRMTVLGAATGLDVYHGSELEFVFGNLTARSGTTDVARAFSADMMGYWTRFAAAGDPNTPGAYTWPARGATLDTYLELGEKFATGTDFHAATCDQVDRWRAAP